MCTPSCHTRHLQLKQPERAGKEGMLCPPVPVPELSLGPSSPVKDWKETTEPKKKMQTLFSSKNSLSARSPWLGKFGELKELMSTENQVWYRIKHRGKCRLPPSTAPGFQSSPRSCSSLTAMPSSPFLAGPTPAPSQLEFWHPAAFLLLCLPGSLLFWQCRLLL